MNHVKSSDLDLRTNALLCIANLSSNKANHSVLEQCCKINELIENLECHDGIVQLHAITSLRGLSTDISLRKQIITAGGTEVLLSLVRSEDESLKLELLSTLCNLSLGGCMGDRANAVLQKIDMPSLIAFMCNNDSATHRMFGAVAIGNIASHIDLQAPVFESGALKPLIELSDNDTACDESQRCMAYAICNLSAELPHRLSIITRGGLPSIMFLCHTGDISDMLAALSTIRGLAASADARRLIFEEGVTHVLSLAMKSGNLQCKREAASILVNLSLNEENKFDIAHSNEIKDLVSLLDETDVACVSQTCRAMGNISEVVELHVEMLDLLTMERLVLLTASHIDSEVKREVVRCIANLSSNFRIHEDIAHPRLLKNLCQLCSTALVDAQSKNAHEQLDIARLSVLGLANICMNVEAEEKLDIRNLLSVFYEVLSWNSDLSRESSDAAIEAKCFVCMAISAVCAYASATQILIEIGMIRALLESIKSPIPELRMSVAFAFNKLSMIHSTHRELSLQQVPTTLIDHASASNSHCVTYSIATLRRISDNEVIRSEMIANNVLNFYCDACNAEDTERSREIASSICYLALWEEAKIPLAKSQMLKKILILCDSSDVETSRFALGSLANISENIQSHEMILRQDSIIQQMVQLSHNPTISIARESCRVLANLLSSTSCHEIFLNNDGMACISHVSEFQDNETVHNAAVSLRKLASNITTHEAFFDEDSITTVINMSKVNSLQTKMQSAAALRDISSNPDFQLAFVEVGAMRAAIELASHTNIGLKIVAVGIIKHLSVSMSLKVRLLQSGIVNIMADCIANINDCDLLCQCASSIANIAEHAQCKVELVQMGSLRCLVSLSKSGSVEVMRETARAFSLLSSAPENLEAFDKYVISTVIDLLCCQEEETL
jgi:hypothetical protein